MRRWYLTSLPSDRLGIIPRHTSGICFVSALYLLRFDDICPTMRWSVWETVEPLLVRHLVRPVIGLVVDNQDPSLRLEEPRTDFWERVRGWQKRGWTIGFHAFRHVNHETSNADAPKQRGEFAGRHELAQRAMLTEALELLRQQDISEVVWAPEPGSYDRTTLRLLHEFGIRVIVDGSGSSARRDAQGYFWLPRPVPKWSTQRNGVWTIGLTINSWTPQDIEELERQLWTHASEVTDVPYLKAAFDRHPSRTGGLSHP